MKKRSTAASIVAAAGLVVLAAPGASAHVTVTPSTTEAGAYSVLTFSVPHGCGDSATTGIAIQVPEEFSSVTPTVNPGWDVELVMETLDTPVDDGHGGELTERVGEVLYTAQTPLPDGLRDAFELSVRLPDTPGEDIAFPVVQTCEEGEAAWVQLPADGQDADALDEPAPVITLTDDGGSPAAVADAGAAAADGDAAAADPASGDAGTPALAWVALALGAGGLVLGGLALARTRRA